MNNLFFLAIALICSIIIVMIFVDYQKNSLYSFYKKLYNNMMNFFDHYFNTIYEYLKCLYKSPKNIINNNNNNNNNNINNNMCTKQDKNNDTNNNNINNEVVTPKKYVILEETEKCRKIPNYYVYDIANEICNINGCSLSDKHDIKIINSN